MPELDALPGSKSTAASSAPCASPTASAPTPGRERSSVFMVTMNPMPSLAEQVLLGNAAVVENKLAGGGAADAHLLFLLAEGEAGRPFLHDEGAGAARPLCGVGQGDDGVYLGLAAVGDELLGAVE